ncbi:hypothetical protein FOZ63_021289, partial [Perkinsus olseni]
MHEKYRLEISAIIRTIATLDEHADEDEGAAAAEEDGHGAYNEDELFLGDLAKSSKFLAESEECEEQ